MAVASLLFAISAPLRRFTERLSREVITECLMVLVVPSGAIRLGRALESPTPDVFRSPRDETFKAFVARFERCSPNQADHGADDWSDLDQRMHFILHLFCSMHEQRDLFSPPFSDSQLREVLAGRLPDGRL
jgi:hypothetical protein